MKRNTKRRLSNLSGERKKNRFKLVVSKYWKVFMGIVGALSLIAVAISNFDEALSTLGKLPFFDNGKMLFYKSNRLNVLILPFSNLQSCNYKERRFDWILHKQLDEIRRGKKLNVDIQRLDTLSTFISHEEANKLGSEYNADLVIWGDFIENDNCDTTHVDIYFEKPGLIQFDTERYSLGSGFELNEVASTINIARGSLNGKIEDFLLWFIGHYEYKRSNYASARSHFQDIEGDLNNTYVNLQIANCFKYEGSIDSAIMYYNKILERDPNCPHAYINISDAYHFYGMYDLGIKYIKKAIEFSTDLTISYIGYCQLAHLLIHDDKHEKALKTIDKAIEMFPENPLGYSYKIDALNSLGKTDYVFSLIKKCKTIFPDESIIYSCEAEVYHDMEEYDKAIKSLRKAVKLEVSSASLWSRLGHMNYHTGSYRRAVKYFKKALEIDSTYSNAYGHLAMINLLNGETEKAKDLCNKGLSFRPSSELLLLLRAEYYFQEEVYELAKRDYKELCKIDDKNLEYLLNLSLCYYVLKKYDESLIELEKVLKIDSLQSSGIVLKAMNISKVGEFADAEELFNLAQQIDPNYYGVYGGRALFYMQYEWLDEALNDLSIFFQKYSSKDQYLDGNEVYLKDAFSTLIQRESDELLEKVENYED